MKKIYLTTSLITFIGLCSSVYGQTTNTFPENGNVGIGTTSPTHKLTIEGDIRLNGSSKSMTIGYASLSESVGGASTILGNNVKAGVGDNTIKRFSNGGDAGSFVSLNYANGITFHTGVNSLLDSEVSSSEQEAMRITHSGNVGIGTNDTKGYKLAVNGKMRTHEIKVEVANWPDFVFAKDYKVPTLLETEKHIKQNGHLPGIPSATEVKANGIDLGEMNAKLLQKIEELTLHLIEMKKEMESLKSKLK